jgi:hypothetical protein
MGHDFPEITICSQWKADLSLIGGHVTYTIKNLLNSVGICLKWIEGSGERFINSVSYNLTVYDMSGDPTRAL